MSLDEKTFTNITLAKRTRANLLAPRAPVSAQTLPRCNTCTSRLRKIAAPATRSARGSGDDARTYDVDWRCCPDEKTGRKTHYSDERTDVRVQLSRACAIRADSPRPSHREIRLLFPLSLLQLRTSSSVSLFLSRSIFLPLSLFHLQRSVFCRNARRSRAIEIRSRRIRRRFSSLAATSHPCARDTTPRVAHGTGARLTLRDGEDANVVSRSTLPRFQSLACSRRGIIDRVPINVLSPESAGDTETRDRPILVRVAAISRGTGRKGKQRRGRGRVDTSARRVVGNCREHRTIPSSAHCGAQSKRQPLSSEFCTY